MLQGDKYGKEDGDLYFNSKTGMPDDVYGDYAFGQPEEHSSCKLGPSGAPILDGDMHIFCLSCCSRSSSEVWQCYCRLHCRAGTSLSCLADFAASLPGAGAYKGMCDLQLTGANKLVPLLSGGLDGIYKVHTCENGRPAFRRAKGPKSGEQQVAIGTKPACLQWCTALNNAYSRCRMLQRHGSYGIR